METKKKAKQSMDEPEYKKQRENMVASQIKARGVKDERVLQALNTVPRHLFVPPDMVHLAYRDFPLSIGMGQTISQPYIVGLMSELADIQPEEKVLEVGTGCGYQAAVLSELAKEVYTIEIIDALYDQATARLKELGYDNVRVRHGDGYWGWPEHAPFDAIIVTAAPAHIPERLIEQLALGKKLIVPVGSFSQDLKVVTKTAKGIEYQTDIAVSFVPMTGEIQHKE